MKRILVVVLFFAFAGMGLFAQNNQSFFNFVWDLGMDINFVKNDENKLEVLGTPKTRYVNPDVDRMFFMQMEADYVTPTWGVAFKGYFASETGRNPQIYTAYGWFKTFDGILLTNLGWIENDLWATKGGIPRADEFALDSGGGSLDVREGSGIQFNVNPALGLNFGAAMYTRNDRTIGIKHNKFVLAANYEMEGVFSVQACFANKEVPTEIIDFQGILCAGLSFDLIDDFTFIVDGQIFNFMSPDISIYQTVGYKMDEWEFGALVAEEFAVKSTSPALLNAYPWVSYAIRGTPIGTFVPRLQVGMLDLLGDIGFKVSPRVLWVNAGLPRFLLGYDATVLKGVDPAHTLILEVYWSY